MEELIRKQLEKVNEEFRSLKEEFDKFFEKQWKEFEERISELRPAVEEAERKAEVKVEETPEGEIKATVHGEAVIKDPDLKRRILEEIKGVE